jgi:hypothetical protein
MCRKENNRKASGHCDPTLFMWILAACRTDSKPMSGQMTDATPETFYVLEVMFIYENGEEQYSDARRLRRALSGKLFRNEFKMRAALGRDEDRIRRITNGAGTSRGGPDREDPPDRRETQH